MRALIVEQGASRGALAAARALSDAGWTVGVGSPDGGGLASSSRACSARHQVPAAHQDLAGFLGGVVDAVVAGGYEVVFGAGEAEVLALSAHRDRIAAVVPHAPHAVVCRALDKQVLHQEAVSAGLQAPVELSAATLPEDGTRYVVKARVHARPGRAGAPPRLDTVVLTGGAAVRRRVDEIEALGGNSHVQQFHHGTLVAYSAVLDRSGAVVADCQQVAARIWPPLAGASARARTVPLDPLLTGRCADLLRSLGWFGLAEVQLLVGAGGDTRVIDLNGRFYGSLGLAVAAGANLPAAWANLATGRAVDRSTARPGMRYQWLHADLRQAWRSGPGRPAELLRTLAAAPASVHSVASVRDPRPFVVLARSLLPRTGTGGRSGRLSAPGASGSGDVRVQQSGERVGQQ